MKQHNGIHIPRRGPRLTFTAVACGLLTLRWLSQEDSSVWPVIILAAALSIVITTLTLTRFRPDEFISMRKLVPAAALFGGASGALTAPLAAGLMLFKTAQHGHANPEYPFEIISATIQRIPAWAAAGTLLGLGTGLVAFALMQPRIDNTVD